MDEEEEVVCKEGGRALNTWRNLGVLESWKKTHAVGGKEPEDVVRRVGAFCSKRSLMEGFKQGRDLV